MLEEEYQDDFTIDDPEDKIDFLKNKLKEVEDLHDEILVLKQKRTELKNEIETIIDPQVILDEEDKFKGFVFHPFIDPYVTQEVKGKHASAVVELLDCNMVFQIQAQNVTDFNKVQSEIHTNREQEEKSVTTNSRLVKDVLKEVEDLFEVKTRNRIQTRIVKKTR